MEYFPKIVNDIYVLIIFGKHSAREVWQRPKYAFFEPATGKKIADTFFRKSFLLIFKMILQLFIFNPLIPGGIKKVTHA